jgi:uncharacterized phage protein gp47/JayE
MSTPAYAPPSIGSSGLTVNSYQSILQDNVQGFLNIYGANQYVGPDSAIFQLLSILSLKQADQNTALQLAYNQASPSTAVGAGLDRDVKMNGLARAVFTYSTAVLTVVGTSGAVVTNGFAQDQNGNLWALPSPLTIVGGSVNATSVCTTPGNVTAEPGTINIISTPQSGWTPPSGTVTNALAATAGAPIEADSKLRARQSISVALPALTPLASTIAAVLATLGVVRVAPGYPTGGGPGTSIENPTATTDSWGNPAHSITMVVQGGSDAAVGLSIYLKKTIGCFTNGTTSTIVADPNTGYEETISFYRPTSLAVWVYCAIHGYGNTPNSATLAAVQAAIVAYLNELAIGETVSIAAVSYEAMAVNSTLQTPSFGVRTLNIGLAAATTTCTTVASDDQITVAVNTGIADTQWIFGAGIPVGTTVTNVSGTTITMSANATVGASAVPVVFVAMDVVDIIMPEFYDAALGAAATTFTATV